MGSGMEDVADALMELWGIKPLSPRRLKWVRKKKLKLRRVKGKKS